MPPSGFSAAGEQAADADMTKKVLFICTGNYYRSRFAEMLFNALASQKNLDWNADSRGLAPAISNAGPVYPLVLEQLKALGIRLGSIPSAPVRLEKFDLQTADLVIALNEAEHRPLMAQQFNQWVDHTSYWEVPDLYLMRAEEAFSRIEKLVTALVQQLQNHPVALALDPASLDPAVDSQHDTL